MFINIQLFAHKKGLGSSKNGRESQSKRLGIKKSDGQSVIPGNIIVRQRGTKIHPGDNVGCGKDYTLYALTEGKVEYAHIDRETKKVNVVPTKATKSTKK